MKILLIPLLLLTLARPADAQPKRFVAFGDSITVGLGDGAVECTGPTGGYPLRLSQRLVGQGVENVMSNRGKCGEQTTAGITRIESVLDEGGDVIMIMEGTNDVSQGVGRETILFNLNEMARKAEERRFVVVMSSILPRGPEVTRDPNNMRTETLAVRLREDAREAGRPFADPFFTLINEPDLFDLLYADSLHPNAEGYGLVTDAFLGPALQAAAMDRPGVCDQPPQGPCVVDDATLCLNEDRFRVDAFWRDFDDNQGGGHSLPQTDESGAFWFFSPENVELIVKVLDGRGFNDHFWVFYGSLSSVEFMLRVIDTETGQCREYFNPLGNFASVGDTEAFFMPE